MNHGAMDKALSEPTAYQPAVVEPSPRTLPRLRVNAILWALVAANVVLTVATTVFPNQIPVPILIPLVVFLPLAFALLHGAVRYGWAGILAFLVVCLVVSNVLENSSILTGFPFGHYYYTAKLGPKLFLVPLLIGPAYVGTGYLAWVLGTVLVGDVRPRGSALTTFAVPLIASFVMVAWDLGMDPTNSTIRQTWIWQQGGGYFGVPLTNFLGWSLTVYVFFQLFALYLYFRQPRRIDMAKPALSRSHYAEAVVMYARIGLGIVLAYLVGSPNTVVTDASGVVWQSSSIAEGEATVTIYTILFVTALAAMKLLQRPAAAATHK
jgi:putative membrane protein